MRYSFARLVALSATFGGAALVACGGDTTTAPRTISQQTGAGNPDSGNTKPDTGKGTHPDTGKGTHPDSGTGPDTTNAGPGPVTSAIISPTSLSFYVGNRVAMTAFGLNAAGKKVGGRQITWTTSDPAVVTVDAGGFASAIAVGTATITAAIDGFKAKAPVSVAANEFVPTFTVNGVAIGYTPVSGPDSAASATGLKVPGATVKTYKIMTATFDSLATPELVNTTTTDAAGAFVVHALPSAYYSIKVTPPASSPYAPGASFVGPQRIPQTAVIVRLSPKP